jgi:hypothetical protein
MMIDKLLVKMKEWINLSRTFYLIWTLEVLLPAPKKIRATLLPSTVRVGRLDRNRPIPGCPEYIGGTAWSDRIVTKQLI